MREPANVRRRVALAVGGVLLASTFIHTRRPLIDCLSCAATAEPLRTVTIRTGCSDSCVRPAANAPAGISTSSRQSAQSSGNEAPARGTGGARTATLPEDRIAARTSPCNPRQILGMRCKKRVERRCIPRWRKLRPLRSSAGAWGDGVWRRLRDRSSNRRRDDQRSSATVFMSLTEHKS